MCVNSLVFHTTLVQKEAHCFIKLRGAGRIFAGLDGSSEVDLFSCSVKARIVSCISNPRFEVEWLIGHAAFEALMGKSAIAREILGSFQAAGEVCRYHGKQRNKHGVVSLFIINNIQLS